MTLILAAVCQDGIAVCSDKRRTIKTEQKTSYFDDIGKVYRFSKVDALAYNHGINRIRGQDWDCCLESFEAARVHAAMSASDLVESFRDYIDSRVTQELAENQFDDALGFVFCGITHGVQPLVRELFWKKNTPLEDKTHRGELIITGSGNRYVNKHLDCNWRQLTVEEGLLQLVELFDTACQERRIQGGEEFSDTIDTEILKIQQGAATSRGAGPSVA